jgi:NAD(P)-dependent dehydrogenase (short-subunit alcohol dehydrogenase family)
MPGERACAGSARECDCAGDDYDAGDPPEWEEDFIKLAPLRRSGRPSDVAETVAFLARSEFITGQVIVVDGGRTL